ncbi:MAG: T9SS type A sorting domain-containing protein [Bacteroidota bacterium]
MKYTLTHVLFLLLFFTTSLSAQGWKRTIGGNADDPGEAIIQMEDEGYLLVGHGESFGDSGDRDVYVVRYDLNGNVQWTQFYDEGMEEFVHDAVANEQSDVFIVGTFQENRSEEPNAYLLKINTFGEAQWSKSYGAAGDDHFYSIVAANDGGYVMAGYSDSYGRGDRDMFIVKVDEDGNTIWRKNYGSDLDEEANAVTAVSDGYVMAGYVEFDNRNRDYYVVKVNEDGGLVWSRTFGDRFEYEEALDILSNEEDELWIGGNQGTVGPIHLMKTNAEGVLEWEREYETEFVEAQFSQMAATEDGILLSGTVAVTATDNNIYLLKVDNNGNFRWENHFGDVERSEFSYDVTATMDGGVAIVGGSAVFADVIAQGPLDDFVLIKTDGLGNIESNRLEGRVFYDVDEDGTFSEGDVALADWPVKITNTQTDGDRVFYTSSDQTGSYNITVGTGRYTTTVLNQNEDYWTLTRNNIPNFFSTTYDTISMIDFPVTADLFCPYVEVGVSAPSLSICNDVNYNVSYCNIGTAQSGIFDVEVKLDEALTLIEAELPFTQQEDGTYIFEVDNLVLGECGTFSINASVACEGYVVGQSHQVRASVNESLACLEPDPDWDMASIKVEGRCTDEGNVEFVVSNQGDGNMRAARNYTVGLEDLIGFSAPYQLDSERDTIISREARGVTTRIIVEQAEGHPGRSFPTVAVEGCGAEDANVTVQTGFVTMFPEDDADPFVGIDVQENTTDATGNILSAQPKGYREQQFIERGRDISYHIQFQNLGDQPLRHVVIRDTLPEELDIASIQIEASSHAYTYEIYEDRILRFTFDKLELPNVNEDATASKGFIKFRVRQNPGLEKGTIITNRALISSNFSKPVLTNPVRHTIGGELLDFVEVGTVSTDDPVLEGLTVQVTPNPFVENTTFILDGWNAAAQLEIMDASGRLLRTETFQNNQLYFNRGDLSTGIYFYRISNDSQLLSTGKMVIQ